MVPKHKQLLAGVVVPTGSGSLPSRYLKGVNDYLSLNIPLISRDISLQNHIPGATSQFYCGVRSAMVGGDSLEFYVLSGITRATIAVVSFFGHNCNQYKLLLNPVGHAFQPKTMTHYPVIADTITKLFLHPLFPSFKIEVVTSPTPRMKLVKGDRWIVLPTVRSSSSAQYTMFSELNIVDNPESTPRLGRLVNPVAPRWNTRVIERKQTGDTPAIHISKLAAVKPKIVSPSVEKLFDPDYGITSTDV